MNEFLICFTSKRCEENSLPHTKFEHSLEFCNILSIRIMFSLYCLLLYTKFNHFITPIVFFK